MPCPPEVVQIVENAIGRLQPSLRDYLDWLWDRCSADFQKVPLEKGRRNKDRDDKLGHRATDVLLWELFEADRELTTVKVSSTAAKRLRAVQKRLDNLRAWIIERTEWASSAGGRGRVGAGWVAREMFWHLRGIPLRLRVGLANEVAMACAMHNGRPIELSTINTLNKKVGAPGEE